MRAVTNRLNFRTLGAALAGVIVLAASSGAQAWDHRYERERDRWERHHDHDRYWEHRRHWVHERPVYVRERPVVVERPVMVAPMYQAPAPSGLNLNFNIPLN